ncbi:MAG TPA: hypothetical protein VJ761_09330, partial [Ktedonobacteraceae bacterium]|nr:hypothetical protein [Ktedonobacteraceae bacterium]
RQGYGRAGFPLLRQRMLHALSCVHLPLFPMREEKTSSQRFTKVVYEPKEWLKIITMGIFQQAGRFYDQALNRDRAILCERVNRASPHLPDGRWLSSSMRSSCGMLVAQRRARILSHPDQE